MRKFIDELHYTICNIRNNKTKTKHPQIRMILSSLLGSIYAIIVYLNILSIYTNLLAKITLSVVMVYIAFAPPNVKQLLKQILIFYLVSFIFGDAHLL